MLTVSGYVTGLVTPSEISRVRRQIGSDTPVYLSFDIDSIDPSACPGTGTPEIGGLTTAQALEVVRGCKGLNLVSHKKSKLESSSNVLKLDSEL